MEKNAKIYIAGHLGMVGSAIKRNLESKGFTNFVTRTLDELNLLVEADVARFFAEEKPEYVVLAAAKVGGIVANNTYRAQFIYENLMIQNHVIHQSYLHGVKKLLFLGSSCIYPRLAPQPIKEEYLLTGILEPTNEPYAIAKIAGIKMCESYHAQYGCNFISIMPTNLYGQNDNYDLEKSHVLPALIRKMLLGKYLMEDKMDAIRDDLNKLPVEGVTGSDSEDNILQILQKYGVSKSIDKVGVTLWGTGAPMREFLHVDDMADASVFLLMHYDAP
ncbi:MAG TPA: GDP-L-fucose synthase, partial [Paludibacter sp.]|nr:GDP-L-fucose synthase [Paludibacter sp.]